MACNAYPEALEELMEFLRGLPGIGRRSAERMALKLYEWDDEKLDCFAQLLGSLKTRIGKCPECGGMSSAPDEKCAICSSPLRDPSVLCVVEDFPQLRSIEAGGIFKGLYHVLGGRLAPLEGKLADSLAIEPLMHRVETGAVREVILALSPDVEGQATAVYLAGLLQKKTSRSAVWRRGSLPVPTSAMRIRQPSRRLFPDVPTSNHKKELSC